MSDVADSLALVVAAAGLISVVLAIGVTRRWANGLSFALDMWMAAGLLRLVDAPGWDRIGAAAAIVIIRVALGPRLHSPSPASAPRRIFPRPRATS